MVKITREEKAKRRSINKRTMHYFWSAQWKRKGFVLGAFLTTPLVVLWRDVLITYFFADIISKVTANPEMSYVMSDVVPEAIILVIVRFVMSFVEELRIFCHWKMEIYAIDYLQRLCFNKVAAESMQFHNNKFSGSLVSQINKFSSAYELFMDELIWNIMPIFITIIASATVLFMRVPLIALALLVIVCLYIIIVYCNFRRIGKYNEKMASAENKRTGQLADSISNIISVKSYAREKYEQKRFAGYSGNVVKATTDLLIAELKRNCGFDVIYNIITISLVAFLVFGQSVLGITLGTVILVFEYCGTVTRYLWNFNGIFKHINRIFGDSREMTEILDMKDDVVDEPNAKTLVVKKGAITFDNISFHHHDSKGMLFSDFSLDIKPGERVGFVGVSGSGKTTLTKLLLRFADVDKGEIDIDGQNIRYVTQESLRESIAYVPQETALFHRSIAENIAYARPDATMEEIKRAAKLANADEFIQTLPDGYETLVGERGVKLSGGQRQRVAIARAILKDAPVLVLDEATSALDSESEALIQGALSELMKGRTSLVIAHRLSTVANLDRIVVLDDGKIVEQGSHQDLLKAGGTYSKLWSRQSGAFLEEK